MLKPETTTIHQNPIGTTMPIGNRIGAVKGTLQKRSESGAWREIKSDAKSRCNCEEDRLMYNTTSLVSQRISINEFPCDNCHSAFLKLSIKCEHAIVVNVTHCAPGPGGYKDFHPETARDHEVFIHYVLGTAYYHSTHVVNPVRGPQVETDAEFLGRSSTIIDNGKNFLAKNLAEH